MQVTASAPAPITASATSMMRSVFALSFAHRGRPHTAVAAITSADSDASWAKIEPRPLRFGHERFTSTATTSGGAAAQQLRRLGVVLETSTPDARHNGRSTRDKVAHDVVEPVLHTRPRQPDGVDHALRRGVQAWRGVAGYCTPPATWSRQRPAHRGRGTRRARCRTRQRLTPSSPAHAVPRSADGDGASITTRSPPALPTWRGTPAGS